MVVMKKSPLDYFKSLDLSKLDSMTSQYIKESVLTLPNINLLEGTKEFEELQSIIESDFPEAIGIKPKEIETPKPKIEEKPAISKEDLKKLKQLEIDDIKSQIQKMEELSELLMETQDDEKSKETLELFNETLPDLKAHLKELEGKFEDGGDVGDEKLYYVVAKKNGQLVDVTELPMTKEDAKRWIKEQGIENHYDFNTVDIIPYHGTKPRFKFKDGGNIGKKYKQGDFVFAKANRFDTRIKDESSKIPFFVSHWSHDKYYVLGDGSHYISEDELTHATEKDFNDYYGENASEKYKHILKDGGKVVGYSGTYYKVVNNFVYFCLNYPQNFFEAFHPEHIREHIKNKFGKYYDEAGSYGAMVKLWSNLDLENKKSLTKWIKENYKETEYAYADIDGLYSIINHFVYFCLNYPQNFTDAFEGGLKEHIESKFKNAYEKAGSFGAMIKLWSDLDNGNREKFANWIEKNYNEPLEYKDGGSVRSKKYGIYVFGGLHDTFSDELLAGASAHSLRSIHPEWKIEVRPVKKMEDGGSVEKKYSHDGQDYTEEELIDFADSASTYDQWDAESGPITTIEDAIEFLGKDNVSEFKNGGSIPDNYKDKTPKQIWRSWSAKQRSHFLIDHEEHISEISKRQGLEPSSKITEFVSYKYDELPEDVKDALLFHKANGEYKKGGGISDYNKFREDFGKKYDKSDKNGRIEMFKNAGYDSEYSKELSDKDWKSLDSNTKFAMIYKREYKKGGDVSEDKFSLAKTTIENSRINQMVIGEGWTVKEFDKHFTDKGYTKKSDKSLVGFYFFKPNGDTVELVPSFHKKGEILEYKNGGKISKPSDKFEVGTPVKWGKYKGEVVSGTLGVKGISLYGGLMGEKQEVVTPDDWNDVKTYAEADDSSHSKKTSKSKVQKLKRKLK